jgi:hypothetical protein
MSDEILEASEPVTAEPLRLIPFEDPNLPGFWERVGAMFQLLFAEPFEFFERAPRGEGLGAPWRFLLLLSVPALLLLGLIFGIFGAVAIIGALADRRPEASLLALMPVVFLAVLALIPLFMFLGMVVGGAINHACLWMWGGTRNGLGLEQTIRATGYAHAFIQLGAWIPYLGLLVQLLGLVWIGIGLARLHRTDTWRGLAAVFTPILLLCVCLMLALAFIPLALLLAAKS